VGQMEIGESGLLSDVLPSTIKKEMLVSIRFVIVPSRMQKENKHGMKQRKHGELVRIKMRIILELLPVILDTTLMVMLVYLRVEHVL
jgi:hypothetical protein